MMEEMAMDTLKKIYKIRFTFKEFSLYLNNI